MNIKRLIILCGGGIIIIFAIIWLFNHSFLVVTSGATSGYKLIITDQKTGKKIELSPKEKTTKRLVGKGSYEVVVSEKEQSYVTVTGTSGFLRSTTVNAKLNPEHTRKFVGDNPGPCMYYSSVLASYGCSDTFDQLVVHMPATAATPTFTQKNTNASNGYIESIFRAKQGTLALLRAPEIDEEDGAPQSIISLDDVSWKIKSGYALEKLEGDITYSAVSYKDGFLVYNTGSNAKYYYYSSLDDEGKELSLAVPKTKNAQLVSIVARGNMLAAFYATNTEEGDADVNSKGKTEIVVERDGRQPEHYRLSEDFSSIESCGENIICLLNAKGLAVYDIAGPKAKLLFRYASAKSVKEVNKQLYIVTDTGVVVFSPSTKSGYISYSFGDYTYCGIETYEKGYVLCLITKSQDKVALAIDVTQTNTTSIDKKVSALFNLPEINKLSIYENFIYISPNLGELIYDEAQESFVFDPVKKQVINGKIREVIDAQKIDRTIYRIINTLD